MQTIEDDRAGGDLFKLPKQLRDDVDADRAVLVVVGSATALAEGARASANAAQRAAFKKLARQLCGRYRLIAAIDETTFKQDFNRHKAGNAETAGSK